MAILQFILRNGSKILHRKSQVISIKNEGVTAIFPNFDFILNRENQRHAFIFAQNYLKFFVQNLRTTMQKNHKISIVILPLYSAKLQSKSHKFPIFQS